MADPRTEYDPASGTEWPAAPSTPEPSGWKRATAKGTAIDVDEWNRPLYVRAAPSTEPALDVERLARALRDHCHDSADEGSPIFLRHAHIAPFLTDACAPAIARRYARLAESQP